MLQSRALCAAVLARELHEGTACAAAAPARELAERLLRWLAKEPDRVAASLMVPEAVRASSALQATRHRTLRDPSPFLQETAGRMVDCDCFRLQPPPRVFPMQGMWAGGSVALLHVPELLNVEALLVRAGQTADNGIRERAEHELRFALGSRGDRDGLPERTFEAVAERSLALEAEAVAERSAASLAAAATLANAEHTALAAQCQAARAFRTLLTVVARRSPAGPGGAAWLMPAADSSLPHHSSQQLLLQATRMAHPLARAQRAWCVSCEGAREHVVLALQLFGAAAVLRASPSPTRLGGAERPGIASVVAGRLLTGERRTAPGERDESGLQLFILACLLFGAGDVDKASTPSLLAPPLLQMCEGIANIIPAEVALGSGRGSGWQLQLCVLSRLLPALGDASQALATALGTSPRTLSESERSPAARIAPRSSWPRARSQPRCCRWPGPLRRQRASRSCF